MAFEPGKNKPETCAADGTLPDARAHAIGVRVVQVERERTSVKSGRRCVLTVIVMVVEPS